MLTPQLAQQFLAEQICGVYRLIHVPSGRSYVGSSINLARRHRNHVLCASKGRGQSLHRAMKELGTESFSFEILETCNPEERFALEKHYIQKYNTLFPNGFNLCADPEKGWDYLFTESIKAKIGAANKGRVWTPEMRERASRAHIGIRQTPESNEKKRAAMIKAAWWRGSRLSPETKEKISNTMKCRKISQEQKKKLSLALAGRVLSPETRAKISKAKKGNKCCLGRKVSQETRLKISQNRWHKNKPAQPR